MISGRESFWAVVHEPFMSRDLTREDLREVVRRGLELAGGNYRNLLSLFNMPEKDYKPLLNFLRKFQSHVPVLKGRPLNAGLRESSAPMAIGE
jgi:hypothetical protein